MVYLQKNKKQNKNQNKITLIILLVITLVLFFAPGQVSKIIHFVNIPLVNTKNKILGTFYPTLSYFSSKKDLFEKNQALQEENKKLKIEILTIDFLQNENEKLKDALNYIKDIKNPVTAKVLNRSNRSPTDSFVISAGFGEIKEGDTVYHLNVPIGYVDQVYGRTANVKLLSYSGNKISVSVITKEELSNLEGVRLGANLENGDVENESLDGESEEDLIFEIFGRTVVADAIGLGGGSFKISLPNTVKIDEDDSIIFDGAFIGKVGKIAFQDSDSFQTIYFNFPFKPSDIDFVTVSSAI